MSSRDVEKETQFITMVQTGLLVRYSADPGDGTAPLSRPCWAIEHLEDAFKLAPFIPPDVSAAEAAAAFMTWLIDMKLLTGEQRTILGILLNEPD